MSYQVSDPQKLLDAMQEARDAALGASVSDVLAAHQSGMEIIPTDITTRPALLVPRKMFEALRERMDDIAKDTE